MIPNRLAFSLLAGACLAAAAGGGYLATRQNAVPAPALASAPSTDGTEPAAQPVQETEALVGDSAVPPRRVRLERSAHIPIQWSPSMPQRQHRRPD